MMRLGRNLGFVLLALLAVSLLFSFFLPGRPQGMTTVNDIARRVNAGEVRRLVLNDNAIEAELALGGKLSAVKESGVGVFEILKALGVADERLAALDFVVENHEGRDLWVGFILPTFLPVLFIALLLYLMMQRASQGVNQAFTFGRSNIQLFANFKDRVTFKDVAGLHEVKQELEEVVEFLKSPEKFLGLGARIPRGVLLVGPPGTGKTLLARALAGEANVPFFHISASEFVEMFVGVGASRTRDAFSTAKKAAPAILFIDEIDAIGRERGAGLGGGHDEREQTLNQILVEMDGFDRDTNVIVLAATNRPDILDAALLRPGRFDRRVMLDLPDAAEREAILKLHAKNKPLEPGVDMKKIAARTPGFSGADLANITNEAAIIAARRNKVRIGQDELHEAIEKVMLGPARTGRVISERERDLTAYHEAGHALVAASLKDSDPVHKVSIISRGRIGGFTLKLPLEEQRLKTRSQFLADLAVMLGGYAAEKTVYGDISTGASNDLQNASELSRSLVTRFGMSEKLGPVTFGGADEVVFLGREIGAGKNYSETVASEIDAEIKRFITRAFKTATKIVSSQRAALKAIAQSLIAREVLEQEEFYALVKPFNLKPARV